MRVCDIDIALVMFSPSGRLIHFSGRRGIEDVLTRYINLPESDRAGTVQNREYLIQMLAQLKRESDDVADVELTTTTNTPKVPAGNLTIEELQREIRGCHHQMELIEYSLRLYKVDQAALTSMGMDGVEAYLKLLQDILGRVQERKRFLLCSHVGSFDDATASTSAAMQQHMYFPPPPQQQQHGDIAGGGGYGSDEVASWVSEGMTPATSAAAVASMFAGPPESTVPFREQRGTYGGMHRDAAMEAVGLGMQMCHVEQPGQQSDDSWQQAYTSAELLSALIPSTPFPLDDEMDPVMLSSPMMRGVQDHHRPTPPVDDAAAGCSQVPTDNSGGGGMCSHGLPRVQMTQEYKDK
ncbi:hypothetical protein GUJ93_ZPchr0012g20753 [Zizania palustris]|uniref:MADS-box domain-containing protein n=1 Tax=Zizania palustris TaxID=103762 RepID=A0A8J5WL72_ZIZPA|nr:hypothetical protein GUJ93_ZPchr0012g20753 [Zizania palustris]